ncbi:hypothetical protein LCGC14_0474110 [marine sediment metagenome]|uniref:Uncharacterized protein n=1 Tax=marine sediment metagenome TaxID=412755 RepID=A0A0F9UYA8_9ZZZZ|nr:hypothetical protein [bacterium]
MKTIRDTFIELIDFLKETMFRKNLLERPSYMELSKKLGFTYNWIKDKKDTLKTHHPQKKTFDDLFTRLSQRYREILNDDWNTIEAKFQNLYDIAFPLEAILPSSTTNTQKSIKRKFFDEIKNIIKHEFPNARVFDTDISRIFFNRPRALKDSHLKGNYKFRKLEKSTLFSMIYKIRFLTKTTLAKKVRDISSVEQLTLNNLKEDIETYIIDFIFSNPYNEKYINDEHDIGTIYFKPEFDLTFDIWLEISKRKKKPLIIKKVGKLVKYDSFGRLTRGYIYSWTGLMKMLKHLIKLLPSIEYSKIFELTWKYIEKRYLYPALPRIYHASWYSPNTIKFHVLMLIIRGLGLDILNLEPIDPKAFNHANSIEFYTFERHHLFINDKFSIDVNRLVLVMRSNHRALEGKTVLVLDLIRSRINLTLDCPRYYKKNLKNWRKLWQHYLERREYLIENGIEKFLEKFFTDEYGNNYLLERFFKYVPKGKIDQEITKIMQDWISKGRPAPILNSEILGQLSLVTPYLVNNDGPENELKK